MRGGGRHVEARAHGVRACLASHPHIRRLKRSHPPSIHGTRQWPSSWLLIDYLSRHPIRRSARVLDAGAGWGLTGIYCARCFGARVTAVDKDPDVFPFLELHARLNRVRIQTLTADLNRLSVSYLARFDALLGSDVCFWSSVSDAVRRLLLRARRAGVRTILVADPSRSTFETMARYFVSRDLGEVVDWETRRPLPRSGRILRVWSRDGSS